MTSKQPISTIEDLATLMQGEFLVIRERFDGVDQRLDGIDQRLDGIDQRLDGIDQRLDGMDQRFDRLEMTVNRIDHRTQNQVDSVYEDTSVLKTDVKEAKEDIVLIKKHVGMAV